MLLPLLFTQVIIVVVVLFLSVVARKALFNGAFEFPLAILVKRAISIVGAGLLIAILFAIVTKFSSVSSFVFVVTYLLMLLFGGGYPMDSIAGNNQNPSKHIRQFERIVLLLMVLLCGVGLVYLHADFLSLLR